MIDLLPINTKRRSGKKLIGVGFVVIHDTGNPNSTAPGNVAYYKTSANEVEASAHIFVDDKVVITCIPLDEKAWHVMYDKPTDNFMFGKDSNDVAIGVEMCYGDKLNMTAVYSNLVATVVGLLRTHGLKPHHVTSHFILDPTRKTDPINGLTAAGKTWMNLMDDIEAVYSVSIIGR